MKVPSFAGHYGDSYERADFARIQITPFDFLHPQTPSRLIPLIRTAGDWCERIPLISEIAGSLYIKAVK